MTEKDNSQFAPRERIVPVEINRHRHRRVLEIWNKGLENCETLEMLWPQLVEAIALRSAPSATGATPCRKDGRCQYAIDHGAEGLGACPTGKCVEPSDTPRTDEAENDSMCWVTSDFARGLEREIEGHRSYEKALEKAATEMRLRLESQLAEAQRVAAEAEAYGNRAVREISALAALLHWPDCWDTAAYPDLDSCIKEVFKCSTCEEIMIRSMGGSE